ncbi:DUF4277 domain-containing protein [Microcystis aeruginosa CS-573]|jgi:hypothetical protein|nr:DUF4277 domain-containing protein [Microcystis aeruginosa]MDB9394446.1 DUF4277 domain-containing protein [Microcystis aeruginosa CS-573]
MTQLTVKNLDHLGIIAAIIDELGIVDYMNQQLGETPPTHLGNHHGTLSTNSRFL